MRLRQFVWVASELAPAVGEIRDVLGLEVCYSDPGVGEFGLENALLPIGGNFLEVVVPTRDGTAAGRHLQRRGGDGGYMVILQCGDALAERQRIEALGVRTVWRHDLDDACATHFHPSDLPGAILSIDHMVPGVDWHQEMTGWKWAGPEWRGFVRTHVTQAMAGVTIQGDDPAALAAAWGRVLDRPVRDGAHGSKILLDNARLRFVAPQDERGLGVVGIDVLCQDRHAILAAAEARGARLGDDQVMVAGVRVNLL